jgi:hypothetical protein
MSGEFLFCPNSLVPETIPPTPVQGVSMNGWGFSSKPAIPYQRTFRVTLHGMRWFLTASGTFDDATQQTINARWLEEFYQLNGVWDNFFWRHPHLGTMRCRFQAPLSVPAGKPNSGGLLDPLEVMLIEHNPSF